MNREHQQYAYRLAPWRKQIKNMINILIGLFSVACIASIYLYFSAEMTDMKLQIQILHDERNDLTRTIADCLTREGILNSFSEMQKGQLKQDISRSISIMKTSTPMSFFRGIPLISPSGWTGQRTRIRCRFHPQTRIHGKPATVAHQ